MAVQVWIGEKPEHPNERRAIVALARGLEQLDGLYLVLANFSVGGRAIDLVIIKPDGIFILELKHCDGKVFGDVNGPWSVEGSNGISKRLNPGRKNPYNQVISYYYSLINFLNDHRPDIFGPQRAASVDFRSCRRVIVIAPTIQAGSKIEVDWKVDVKGLDELSAYLVTERSAEIELSETEMLAIPQLLSCTRWTEINAVLGGAMRWDDPPAEPEPVSPPAAEPPLAPPVTPAAPPAAATPAASLPWADRVRRQLRTRTGKAAAAFALSSIALLLALLLRPIPQPRPDQPAVLISTSQPGTGAGGVGVTIPATPQSCLWSEYQTTGRRRGAVPDTWENVGVLGTAPTLSAEVVVTLERVSFCGEQIALTWSVQNNTDDATVTLPLAGWNIAVRDEHNTSYALADGRSEPAEIRAAPRQQARGTAYITRPASLNAATLRITLKQLPFGAADWLVPVTQP